MPHKKIIILLTLLELLTLPMTSIGAEQAPSVPCDRTCLTNHVDAYVNALSARNPALAEFAQDARFTENGVELALGDAAWTTVDSMSPKRLIFTDPELGSTVLFASIVENGQPAMLAARLKIRQHEIAELETMITRKRDGFFSPETYAVDRPYWSQPARKSERLGRDELVKIVDSYFNGIVEGRGDITPFVDDCMRYENGVLSNLNPELATESSNIRALSCHDQFASGMLVIVTSITNRRYFLIDEERQIVVAAVTFNHRGNILEVERSDGGGVFVATPQLRQPYSLMIMEAFKLEDGKIRQIEAILQNVPYKMPLGWPLDMTR